MSDFYLVAEVTEEYDSEGSVLIKSFSDFPERFIELKKIFIDYFGEKKELTVEFTEKIDTNIILKFQGFNSSEDIQFLLGKKLFVDSENLVDLPQDTFFIHDLVGSEVFIDNLFFGKLIDVLKLPNNDVYIVKSHKGNEILIPAIKEFVEMFNSDDKKLILSTRSKIFFENEN